MKNVLAMIFALIPIAVFSQENEFLNLPWQHGPVTATIGDKATIDVPRGYMFLDAENTKAFDRLNGNPRQKDITQSCPKRGVGSVNFILKALVI
jgi:uncharacterized membrane-anchored protein